MNTDRLVRLSGGAAIIGGVLRLAAVFAPDLLSPSAVQVAYLTVDVFLLLGLIGVYAWSAAALGWLGTAAFVAAIVGVCLVRSQASFGAGAYAAGAAVWSLGMAVLGARMLMVPAAPRLASSLWIGALVVGLIGPPVLGQTNALLLAGFVFALGFVASGLWLVRTSGEQDPNSRR